MNTYALLMATALFGLLFLVWLDRMIDSTKLGLQLILGIRVIDVFFDVPRVNAGGMAVDLLDVLLGVLFLALVARFLRGWRPNPMVSLVLLIAGLVGFSLLRGAVEYDLAAAVNESRDTLYLLAVILYASFLPADRATRQQVAAAWLTYCKILLGIAALRWVIVLGGLPLQGSWYSGEYWGLRTVTSSVTLSIAHGGLILLPRILRGESTRAETRWAIAFAAAVVVLQHRSVYAVSLCGAAVLVWRHRHRLSRRFVMTMIAMSLVAAGAFVSVLDSGQLADQASTADASSTVTFEWRAAGWAALLDDSAPQGPEEVLFGSPYGAGYQRLLPTGEVVNVAPHNHYLEILLRMGVVGLVLVLGLGVGTWVRLRPAMPRVGDPLLSDSTLAALFTTYLLYMIPYNILMDTGILIGLSISAWAARPRRWAGQDDLGGHAAARRTVVPVADDDGT